MVAAVPQKSPTPAGESVLLTDVSWEMYEKILEVFSDRRLRHTYADGMLEIMAPLYIHEWRKKFIGRMIEMMAWRLRIPITCAGSTTLRKKLKRRDWNRTNRITSLTSRPSAAGTTSISVKIRRPTWPSKSM